MEHLRVADILTLTAFKAIGIRKPYLPERYRPAIIPSEFVQIVLPFSCTRFNHDHAVPRLLNPYFVVGGTSDYATEKNLDRLNDFVDLPETNSDYYEAARYYKIGEMPLYVALEGKNRVLAYRKLRKNIHALVYETLYPKPKELKLHRLLKLNMYALSCTNNNYLERNSNFQILPFPGIVMPLLMAYGVEEREEKISPVKALKYINVWRAKRLYLCGCLQCP